MDTKIKFHGKTLPISPKKPKLNTTNSSTNQEVCHLIQVYISPSSNTSTHTLLGLTPLSLSPSYIANYLT